ncbi:hypothetical protein [Hymenobacter cellulosilyticus]|uniref:Uncharacterized protein n=1 Tax=Hymenobacter cellulosilyticus TaxID=2932248 RepID=A0A8T9Q1F3_9BACT|nr:hypothetical protein [Hymenobacter cellulosilyticus]UOQ70261.1 hypothetical protein MUN79_16055 [Hymenobacter cellulosilyticus]
MVPVHFTGWEDGFQFVAFTRLLMTAGYGLKEAKEAADQLYAGASLRVEVSSITAATELLWQAQRLGATGYLA